METGTNEVVCQKWEESEAGWGVRPDGFSLHVSLGSLERFVKSYWASMPDSVPSEYSRPDGDAYSAGVNDEVFAKVTSSTDGVRFYGRDYPQRLS